jgi:carbonic anhydrase
LAGSYAKPTVLPLVDGAVLPDHEGHGNYKRNAPPVTNLAPLLERNQRFAASDARQQAPRLPFLPRAGLFIVCCMDCRVDPKEYLGLEFGEALVARNTGGRVTPAVIQDIAYAGYLVDSKAPEGPYFEVAIIHHTDCGSRLLEDERLRHGFAERGGYDEQMLAALPVTDPAETVRADVERLRAAPQISAHTRVSGHVYDVDTGLVRTVVEPTPPSA